jgi:hypothetical protein
VRSCIQDFGTTVDALEAVRDALEAICALESVADDTQALDVAVTAAANGYVGGAEDRVLSACLPWIGESHATSCFSTVGKSFNHR